MKPDLFYCSCPDHRTKNAFCKHLLFLISRVAMQINTACDMCNDKTKWNDISFKLCSSSWIERLKERLNNVNNNSNDWAQQFGISYQAPQASLGIDSTGRVIMPNGYGTSSDERIKTNIKTIENALEKTLLLRGVEYNDFRIEPDKKRIGLIAQEVELIIPEVVGEGEMDKIKYISYGPMVGLLIEAIKELNNKVIKLENIFID
jgi:hypothetical protein